MKSIRVKDWFIDKNFNSQEAYAISVSDLFIEKETEKAVLLGAYSDYGKLKFWCPKACLMSEEEIKEEEDRAHNGFRYNELLNDYCRHSSNLKGIRKHMKTSTMLKKIEEAGLKAPTLEELEQAEKAFVEEKVENELAINDFIDHPKFGKGKIVDIAEKTVKIRFEDDTKELLASFAGRFKI